MCKLASELISAAPTATPPTPHTHTHTPTRICTYLCSLPFCWAVTTPPPCALLQELMDNLKARLLEVDFLAFFTRDMMVILTIHLQTLKQSSHSRFPSHPCLVSKEEELRYLRRVSDVFLRVMAPSSLKNCAYARTMFREVMAVSCMYQPVCDMMDADYVNECVFGCCFWQFGSIHAGSVLLDTIHSVRCGSRHL